MSDKPEIKPWAVYNEHEIAEIIGDVRPAWVMEQFPEFRIGKKWRALGCQFAEALPRRVFPPCGHEDKSPSFGSTHGPSVPAVRVENSRF